MNAKDIQKGHIENIDFAEVLYADDTLLVTKNTKSMNAYISAIEEESEYYNMKLNKGKCEVITMNKKNQIRFKDGVSCQRSIYW